MKQLLTSRDVGIELGFSTVHICRLVNENKLKAYGVLSNGHHVFVKSNIEDFKKSRIKK